MYRYVRLLSLVFAFTVGSVALLLADKCALKYPHHDLRATGKESEVLFEKCKALSEDAEGDLAKYYKFLAQDYKRVERFCEREVKRQDKGDYGYHDKEKLENLLKDVHEGTRKVIEAGGKDPHHCVDNPEGVKSMAEAAQRYRDLAQKYADQAEKSSGRRQALCREVARIYERMAQIKEAAGKAIGQSERFDWSEYHALSEKQKALFQEIRQSHRLPAGFGDKEQGGLRERGKPSSDKQDDASETQEDGWTYE